MLNRSFTAVVERNTVFAENFMTEPYECGWAKEARWFIRVLSLREGTRLTVRPQLSPDGLFWCDAESPAAAIASAGTHTLPVEPNFGQWLALKGELSGAAAEPEAKVIIYLALKE
jgi:hypothetical protein